MKDSISGNVGAQADKPTVSRPKPGAPPTARPNLPYNNKSNHNKKSIDGLASFLKEAPSPVKQEDGKITKTNPVKSHVQPSKKKLKSEPGTQKPKLKFGEKFVKSKHTPPSNSVPALFTSPNPDTASRSYIMRSKSHSSGDSVAMNSLLAHNSAQLAYVDLEWPMWCPRKLQLLISPTRFQSTSYQ